MIERTDIDHLDYATTHSRAFLTFNVSDVVRLHERPALFDQDAGPSP